jgi:hypothetical protein
MRSNVPSDQRTAIHSDDISVVDDGSWFETATCVLYPIKPGTALHYITGVDERSCQRYAAGTVKPPAYFLRTLLRTDQGKQWLAAVMDGCDQQWWRDHQRAERIVLAEDQIDRS